MGTIILEGLRFKAYHGYYDEERERGNHFDLTIRVETDFRKASFDDELHGTVDYVQIYKIAKEEMQRPSKLLEHVVSRIMERLIAEISEVQDVEVRLSKLNPPIGGECYAATIIDRRSRVAGA